MVGGKKIVNFFWYIYMVLDKKLKELGTVGEVSEKIISYRVFGCL